MNHIINHFSDRSGESEKTNPKTLSSESCIATYFLQSCPRCGRRQRILIGDLGKQVFCGHCGCEFAANDAKRHQDQTESSQNPILKKAEQLLALLEESKRPWIASNG